MNEDQNSPIDYSLANSPSHLDQILQAAIDKRASDIHFEPVDTNFNVRFRVDGTLSIFEQLPIEAYETIGSRIKILAKLDITNHRFPQDGHMEFHSKNMVHDVRVSTIPTQFGETIVLRIFSGSELLLNIDSHGFEPEQLALIKSLILSPHGLLLTTGPTGSGKTSLLYAILHALDKPERSIVTIEDPIEFIMPSIRQTQVNESINLTYATILRSLLRQDPDVAMIGEIRDTDALLLTIQAAMTGILVLSTFHAFDVPALIVRFMEMGVGRSVVAQAINAVISTRLLRKICPSCIDSYQPTPLELELLGKNFPNMQFKKGKGCNNCHNSGYMGRIDIYEIVHFDNEIKLHIIDNKSTASFYELLASKNVQSLKAVALKKAGQGLTTLEEVIRVVGFEK